MEARKSGIAVQATVQRTAPILLGRQFNCHPNLFIAGRALLLVGMLWISMGARMQTPNFIIETADPNFARQVSQAAEKYRRELAVEWTGQEMPNWSHPCVMTVQAAPHLGAGGATDFKFQDGEVFGWRMSIQGSQQRILDSVLPHEITHMIYASKFRQPLPRWADEGGATSVEHFSERNKHRMMLNDFLRTGRGIAFNQMFAMTEYPPDIMPLYAQGYSLAEFLIQTGGRRKYVEFLGTGLENDDWNEAVRRHYGIKDLSVLQNTWLAWVRKGSPMLKQKPEEPAASGEMLASNQRRPRPEPNLIYHIREKETPATSMAGLEPVKFLSSNPQPKGTVPFSSNENRDSPPSTAFSSNENREISPPASAIAVTVPRGEAKVLPVSGWHAAGSSGIASSARNSDADSYSTQVAHPQPVERPRQTILR
jgi:hypothetical protein